MRELKYVSCFVVFQEIPDETTLAINMSQCPNMCEGCHSPFLREDIGEELTSDAIRSLISPYEKGITCVCIMGGDANPSAVAKVCTFIKQEYKGKYKTAWYSGRPTLPQDFQHEAFDFVKVGPYIPSKGPLNKETTNQKLFRIDSLGKMEDITSKFWNK